MNITAFKAYDVRGRIPDELNIDIAYRIGNALVEFLGASRVVIGRDIRETSAELAEATERGVLDAGADVIDIGLGGTEMVYFGTGHLKADAGIMVTASHNPADYNGLKLVREGSRPISADTGLFDIKAIAERSERAIAASVGQRKSVSINEAYRELLLSYVKGANLKPLKIVSNPGNGGAGLIVDELSGSLPFEFVRVHHEPDGSFPNGVPNPMLTENRQSTIEAIKASSADFGIAWDGDFDRCFFFDEHGSFIEGYYIVGLLAETLLAKEPGGRVVYDPRLTWSTEDIVEQRGGVAVLSKSGHSFIKAVMRENDAVYGGEMSAHHYFRDFYYCDTGMVPWLLIAKLVSESGKSLSELVTERVQMFPASGEINRRVEDSEAVFARVREHYEAQALRFSQVDGISFEFAEWRFNLRSSNTEPVIRLNVESRGDQGLMQERTEELLRLIGGVA